MPRDLTVTGVACEQKPDYSLAWLLAESIRAFYEDPANVKAFEEWEKEYEKKEKGECA